MTGPPKRPSGRFQAVPAPIPPRATTATLLAAGASTEGVAEAERAIVPFLSAAITKDGQRAVRQALLDLAGRVYWEGQEYRQRVLTEHADTVRSAYWRVAGNAERATGSMDARPSVSGVLSVLQNDGTPLPEPNVRAVLRLFGLVTSD